MFRLTGFQSHMLGLQRAPDLIRRNAAAALQTGGNKMAVHARTNHDFTSRTGRAENAITVMVNMARLEMLFFIDANFTTTPTGFNYAVALHDGTRSGWNKSAFTPSHFTSVGGSGGIEADHFMVTASDAYEEYTMDLLRDGYVRALSGTN